MMHEYKLVCLNKGFSASREKDRDADCSGIRISCID